VTAGSLISRIQQKWSAPSDPRVQRTLRIARIVVTSSALWFAGAICRALEWNRTTTALLLLLGVLAFATLRDRVLAVAGAIVASLSLEHFFIADAGEYYQYYQLSRLRAICMFATMLITASVASELSIRGYRRAREAEARREEMGRLQIFSASLMGAQTVSETATMAVRCLVDLFSASRAELRTARASFVWPAEAQPGSRSHERVLLPLEYGGRHASLEVWDALPSPEVASALGNLLELALDRATTFEDRAQLEAVRRGNELRTTILNAVAHDFRTPLTSIKAAATALRASSAAIFGPDRDLIQVINEEADRLEALIRESLALARLESLGEIARELCSIPTIISNVTTRLARYLDRRRVEIDVPPDIPEVPGDRFLLELMLIQVVDNAWKYSRPGARIVISAYRDDHNIGISVWNEGLRIPDYERQRIFDKFYRGVSDRGRTEGSGLGLAIAKSIAEAHRGAVWLEDAPDGTRFQFRLPIEKAWISDASEPDHPAD
jgi:two-component system sensor histidine kinase KdpD